MKLKKAVKKIIALGTGATMIGATLGAGAFAADLGDYPEPFVKDGKFSGMLVVGDKAAAEDVVGVSDIAVSLQFAATKASGSGKSTTSVEGDVWRVGTTSKKMELAENRDTIINGENFRNITTSIDEQELAGLEDGEITTEKGRAGYNQYLNFGNRIRSNSLGSGYVQFLENDDDVAADFFYVRSSEDIARYSLEFKQSLKSDVEDSTGAKSTTGLFLGDYEDETISIFGTEYTIVKARRTSAAGSSAELTLMGGATKDSLEEGETKTYTLEGVDYEVTVTAITDTGTIYAKFSVNGESTRSLRDGETTTLSDGTQIGVTDLIPNEAGDVTADLVEFYIGADKIFLKDTNINDGASSNTMEVANEDIDDVNVIITGTDDNTTFNIDTIQLNVTADDDYYVAAGHYLSEYMDEPDALLGWDILYSGLEDVETETIRIKTSGSDQYDLVFTDGDGNSATIPLAYTSGTSELKLGDSNDDLVINGSKTITKNDYFIVSDVNGQDDGERRTYALRYKGADKVQSGETASVKFDNLGTGKRIEKTFSSNTADTADAEIKLGGATFGVINVSDATSNDFDIKVDLDADSTIASDADGVAINTDAGLKIAFQNHTSSAGGVPTKMKINFSTPDSDDYDNVVPMALQLNISAASGEVQFAEDTSSVVSFISPSEETNVRYAYTSMGAKVKWDNPTNDPDQLTIWYPKQQRLPQVFIVAEGGSVSSGSSESVESVTINRIDVGATKLASEVASVAAQNLILVGGPCANAASAEAKGNPEDCAADYEPGKGLIELVDTGAGNWALVVAGYSAGDTRTATSVIANHGDYNLQGMKAEVTTATSTVREVS